VEARHNPRATRPRPAPYATKKTAVGSPSTSRDPWIVNASAIHRSMRPTPSAAPTAAASLSGLGTAAAGESVGTLTSLVSRAVVLRARGTHTRSFPERDRVAEPPVPQGLRGCA